MCVCVCVLPSSGVSVSHFYCNRESSTHLTLTGTDPCLADRTRAREDRCLFSLSLSLFSSLSLSLHSSLSPPPSLSLALSAPLALSICFSRSLFLSVSLAHSLSLCSSLSHSPLLTLTFSIPLFQSQTLFFFLLPFPSASFLSWSVSSVFQALVLITS